MVHNTSPVNSARPRISVCIANYNGYTLLGDCLDSVMRQTVDAEVEIIVHDDASTDGSLLLLRERYPQTTVLASTQNVGFCVANNRMVAQARGDFVLLLNNDAALAADALSVLLREAERQQPQGILTLPQYDWESGALVDRGCLLDPFYNPVPNLDPKRRDVAMVIGACLWIPRNLWNALGGFPEWFESVAEDLYLCCRARLAGYPVQVAAGSGYRHRQGTSFGGNRVGDSGLATTLRRRKLSERNKTLAMAVCTPSPLLWVQFPLHALLLVCEGLLLSLALRSYSVLRNVYIAALLALFVQPERPCKTRRDVQRMRRIGSLRYFAAFTPWPRKLAMLIKFGLPNISKA